MSDLHYLLLTTCRIFVTCCSNVSDLRYLLLPMCQISVTCCFQCVRSPLFAAHQVLVSVICLIRCHISVIFRSSGVRSALPLISCQISQRVGSPILAAHNVSDLRYLPLNTDQIFFITPYLVSYLHYLLLTTCLISVNCPSQRVRSPLVAAHLRCQISFYLPLTTCQIRSP